MDTKALTLGAGLHTVICNLVIGQSSTMLGNSGLSAVQLGDVQHLLGLLHSDQGATQHKAVKGLSLLMNISPEAAQAIDAKVA